MASPWKTGDSAFPCGPNFGSNLPAWVDENLDGFTKLDIEAMVALNAYIASKGVANLMQESDFKAAAKWAYKIGNEMVVEKLRIEAL